MRRTWLSIVALLVCSPVCTAAVEPKPKVRVSFAIEAPGLRGDLGASLGPTVTAVQTAVEQLLDARFPFFDWVTSGPAAHTLTLTLKERQASLDVEHILVYQASLGAGAPPLHVLYPWDDPPPDPTVLKTDLVTRVQADVARSEAALKTYFVEHVTLVKRVDVENKFILLPVAGVHPENGVFIVEFLADSTTGRIRLTDPLAAPNKGVYCSIDNFRFPPHIDAKWDDQIPTVMREKAQNVQVKVKDFTPKAHQNTSGGTVTSLGGGTR